MASAFLRAAQPLMASHEARAACISEQLGTMSSVKPSAFATFERTVEQ
jgi:hypothetical protein